jgi:ABC-2 type transport system ATP-binding protein
MRMLAGLLKPDEGSASVIGLDPIADDSALHAMLGYMPQKFGLYEDLTVMENLNLYADLRSVTGETRRKPSPACWNLPPSARSPTGWRASSPAA